jgi:hypothetical protein
LGLKTELEGLTQQRRDPGVMGSFEAGDTWCDRGTRVRGKQGPMDACPPNGDIYNIPELPMKGLYLLFKL